ncbi:MAG: hypothetical protein PHU25_15270 [Deltaproteobacteria bacterium]|nr:hypothetical protein [Deltaproteobacteria bacterium]
MKTLLAIIVLCRVCSLDMFPVMTADSQHYVAKAASHAFTREPFSLLAPGHYKTGGYPLFLTAIDGLASLAGADFLTLVVVAQRLLLAAACLLMVATLGAWSAPLALFFSSDAFVAQSNFVLTEGVTIPLAICFSLAALGLHARRNSPAPVRSPACWALCIGFFASYGLVLLCKIHFAPFALVAVPLALDIRRSQRRLLVVRTRLVVPMALLTLLTIAYVAAVSFNNKAAFDRLTPVIGSERVRYWGAWEQVFEVHPELASRASLREFRDGGTPYRFLHGVDKECGGIERFACTGPRNAEQRQRLLAASGLSAPVETLRSFALGFLGGGKQEILSLRSRVLRVNGDDGTIARWQNEMQKRFDGDFNHGAPARIVPGLCRSARGPELIRVPQAVLTLAAIFAPAWLWFRRRLALHGPALYALAAYIVVIAGFSLGFLDEWRYVAPAWAVLAVAALGDAVRAMRGKKPVSPST